MGFKKSDPDVAVESPITFAPCSNGEFCPKPRTARDARAERLFAELVEEKSRRLGISRRAFAQSASGMAAALFVLNQVYGCGSNGSTIRTEGIQCYDVAPSMLEDGAQAAERLMGDEFIFDVQTHTPSPLTPWRDGTLPTGAENFIRTIFVSSDTTMGVLSGAPDARNAGVPNAEGNQQIKDIIDRIGGPRLVYHVNVDPPRGASEWDYMQEAAEGRSISAWKVYPHVGAWRLDDMENGQPFIAKAKELGVRIVAAHRGIAADPGTYTDPSSPVDLVLAAAQHPDMTFLTYHSGWQQNVDEDHPFDPLDPNPRGVDRLIKAVLDEGIDNTGNVYAELGSTWRNLMTSPREAAHVLGKLLLYLGEDRIVWGTDAIFTGSPQEQIVTMRTFQIPQDMQDDYGYPAFTDEIRRKIFGLNAAGAYGVNPDDVRCVIQDDSVEQEKQAYRHDRHSVPVPTERYYGPRTRREYLAFLKWEEFAGG